MITADQTASNPDQLSLNEWHHTQRLANKAKHRKLRNVFIGEPTERELALINDLTPSERRILLVAAAIVKNRTQAELLIADNPLKPAPDGYFMDLHETPLATGLAFMRALRGLLVDQVLTAYTR